MKRLLVANHQGGRKYSKGKLETLVNAQIDNLLDLEWKPADIILIANFEHEFMKVKSTVVPDLNRGCLTGSKMFALRWLFNNIEVTDTIWAGDLDLWANHKFKEPSFKDVGITTYSTPKYNGGSVFWKPTAKDIIEDIVNVLETEKAAREEPTINTLLKKKYKDRVTKIDTTFNVGCSGFVPRFQRAKKPVRVLHFHPTNRIAWETHCLDRNGIDEVAVSLRLELLLRKYYPNLATRLQPDGRAKADKLRRERLMKELAK